MAERDPFSGFPVGEIVFRSTDDRLLSRISEISTNLLESQANSSPEVTYERYELYVASPNAEESEKTAALRWPISKEEHDRLWHPKLAEHEKAELPIPTPNEDALDIFRPEPEAEEIDADQVSEERIKRKRAILGTRLDVVSTVLDEIPDDPFIQSYFDSHGVFDRTKGQVIPLGFNFDGVDRNLYVSVDGKLRAFFHPNDSSRVSQGDIYTVTGRHTSISDGLIYESNLDRASWETAIRSDIDIILGQLRSVPKHYMDRFDEKGYLLGDSHFGQARQIGTIVTKEFFSGYYQFADAAITLLKATETADLFGTLDHENTMSVTDLRVVYVALKHELASRPHLVRLSATHSTEREEEIAEVHVFEYPFSLDGPTLKHRIGGEYGDLRRDSANSIARMSESVRTRIPSTTLDRILKGEAVGTEFTGFSHTDFYNIIEYLSSML